MVEKKEDIIEEVIYLQREEGKEKRDGFTELTELRERGQMAEAKDHKSTKRDTANLGNKMPQISETPS